VAQDSMHRKVIGSIKNEAKRNLDYLRLKDLGNKIFMDCPKKKYGMTFSQYVREIYVAKTEGEEPYGFGRWLNDYDKKIIWESVRKWVRKINQKAIFV